MEKIPWGTETMETRLASAPGMVARSDWGLHPLGCPLKLGAVSHLGPKLNDGTQVRLPFKVSRTMCPEPWVTPRDEVLIHSAP